MSWPSALGHATLEHAKTISASTWTRAGTRSDARSTGPKAAPSRLSPSSPRLHSDDMEDLPTGTVIAPEETKPALKRPPMFKVLLMNDDYTPMEFVVHVLETFFGMDREKAIQIMLAVHTAGSAVVGIYPRDIAETKSETINAYARANQHPLLSTVEMTD